MENKRVSGQLCQCEHAAHFHDTTPRAHTPNGNPGHKYGVRFLGGLVTVVTDLGKFTVCADCAKDCHARVL